MDPTRELLPFLATAVVVILIPGPQVLFVVGRALSYGKRAAMTSAVGGNLGAYTQGLLIAAGLGALVEQSDTIYTTVKLIGAVYLVFLGVMAFRHRHALAQGLKATEAENARREPVGAWKAARQGFLVGITNPKAGVFFAAILPQFTDRASGHVPLQMAVLATLFSAIALVCDATWGLVAGSARDWFARSPRRLAAVGGAGGLAMVGIGLGIAVTGRKD